MAGSEGSSPSTEQSAPRGASRPAPTANTQPPAATVSPLPASLHRPPAEALAALEAFRGFDLAELQESDRHPNSFDLASRAVPAHPNAFGRLAGLVKGYQAERARVWLVSAQPSRAVALLEEHDCICLLYTSPSPRDRTRSRMPSSA